MVHVFPCIEDDVRSLLPGAIRESLNTRVQNLDAACLHIDRRKTAQVSPYRRYQRIPPLAGIAEPVRGRPAAPGPPQAPRPGVPAVRDKRGALAVNQ